MTEVFGVGGIQRMNRHVCLALSRLAESESHKVKFLSLMDGSDGVDDRYLDGDFAFEGYKGNKFEFVESALRELQTPTDVLYATHVRLATLALALRKIRSSLHYGVAIYGAEVWKRLPIHKRFALQRADFVTSISKYTSEQAVYLQNVNPKMIHPVSPALDPFWSQSTLDIPREEDNDLPKGRIILTVTRLASTEKLKGVNCVITAMPNVLRKFPDARYLVVGTGNDIPRLRDLSKEKGVQEQVLFVGEVTDDQLRSYYRNCEIFVLPSKKEGFGIVFLEAMYYKKPVIGGDFGGSRDVIDDGNTGLLVNYGDINQLSQKIIELFADKQKSIEMGKAGYSRLSAMYTFNHFETNLRKVFQNFINT